MPMDFGVWQFGLIQCCWAPEMIQRKEGGNRHVFNNTDTDSHFMFAMILLYAFLSNELQRCQCMRQFWQTHHTMSHSHSILPLPSMCWLYFMSVLSVCFSVFSLDGYCCKISIHPLTILVLKFYEATGPGDVTAESWHIVYFLYHFLPGKLAFSLVCVFSNKLKLETIYIHLVIGAAVSISVWSQVCCP